MLLLFYIIKFYEIQHFVLFATLASYNIINTNIVYQTRCGETGDDGTFTYIIISILQVYNIANLTF